MAFKEWAETAAADPLILPIGGKQYTINPLGYLDAIAVREDAVRTADVFLLARHQRALSNGEPGELSDADVARIEGDPPQITGEQFLQMTLGAALTAMRENNVPERAIMHAATVAQMDAFVGRDAAQDMWENGPNPEALTKAMREALVSAVTTISLATPPQARTSSTKRAASTASTRSRRPAAKKSTGTRSSRSRA